MSSKKGAFDKIRFPWTVAFTVEQNEVLQQLIVTRNLSFSELVEDALAAYIPLAYTDPETGERVLWPSAPRVKRPNKTGKTSRTYGVLFTADQDRVLRKLGRQYHVRFSELIERAFGDYIPLAYHMPWPPAPRLSKTG